MEKSSGRKDRKIGWLNSTYQPAKPPQYRWSSAPPLSQSQALVLCSWRLVHWREWQTSPWQHWATAHQILHWGLPFQLKPASQSGTQSPWPSSSQVYSQSNCWQMQYLNQTLARCRKCHIFWCCIQWGDFAVAHVVIWDSRKMRMKTSKAGTQHANINHTGKGLCSPKGLISQPLLAGLETIRPLGTISFCAKKATSYYCACRLFSPWSWSWKARVNLSVGIVNVVVHDNHEENGNRHTKVTNQTSHLVGTDQEYYNKKLFGHYQQKISCQSIKSVNKL